MDGSFIRMKRNIYSYKSQRVFIRSLKIDTFITFTINAITIVVKQPSNNWEKIFYIILEYKLDRNIILLIKCSFFVTFILHLK